MRFVEDAPEGLQVLFYSLAAVAICVVMAGIGVAAESAYGGQHNRAVQSLERAAVRLETAAHKLEEAATRSERVAQLVEFHLEQFGARRIPAASAIEVREITVTTTAAKLEPASGLNFTSVSCVAETDSEEFCVGHSAVTTDTGACYSATASRGKVMSMDTAELYAIAGGSYVIDCVFGLD